MGVLAHEDLKQELSISLVFTRFLFFLVQLGRAPVVNLTHRRVRAIASSPPGLVFSRCHSSISRRQSTLLTRLRTGACDIGAYRAHFGTQLTHVRLRR